MSLQSLESTYKSLFSEKKTSVHYKLQPAEPFYKVKFYTMAQPENLNSTLIANCVFNAFLFCTAIMLNIITILALKKTSSLPKPLKTLLLSLSVSDLGVGLLVQPLYIAGLVMMIEKNTETQTFKNTSAVLDITGAFLFYATFFGVVALSADRFLAIHLHLRYQELVTHKRVVAVMISFWMFSAIVAMIEWWTPKNVRNIIVGIIEGVCYLTAALFYFKIYLAVRHHRNQIQTLQVQPQAQNEDAGASNFARLIKSAVSTFYVYLVFLACYLPNLCLGIVKRTPGELSTVTWHLSFCTITLVFLNSSLNPLIYCWKMRHIRHTFMEILRNIFPSNN